MARARRNCDTRRRPLRGEPLEPGLAREAGRTNDYFVGSRVARRPLHGWFLERADLARGVAREGRHPCNAGACAAQEVSTGSHTGTRCAWRLASSMMGSKHHAQRTASNGIDLEA